MSIVKYNSLLGMFNRIKETYAAIGIYMQQRYDALLKVAQTVVEYAKYEVTTLKEITRMRALYEVEASKKADRNMKELLQRSYLSVYIDCGRIKSS